MTKISPASQIKICVSGIPGVMEVCSPDALDIGRTLGHALAHHKIILTTTSTTGFPLWSAIGTHQEGGMAIAFSPATSEREHTEVYKLPIEYFNMMIYTGFGTAGAGVLALRSSDAIIFGSGGMSTLLELSIAVAENKPIGIIAGSWDIDDVIQSMLVKHYPDYTNFLVDRDPVRLLEQLIKRVKYQKGGE